MKCAVRRLVIYRSLNMLRLNVECRMLNVATWKVLEHRCALFSAAAVDQQPPELTLETIFVPPGEDGEGTFAYLNHLFPRNERLVSARRRCWRVLRACCTSMARTLHSLYLFAFECWACSRGHIDMTCNDN